MDEIGIFWRGIGDVMVNDDPFWLVEPRFEREVRDPCGLFTQIALFPLVVMIRLQRDVRVEKFFGEPLEQHARSKAIEITFVRDDDFGFRLRLHDSRLIQVKGHGERGFSTPLGLLMVLNKLNLYLA